MFLKLNRVLKAAYFDVNTPGWTTGDIPTSDIFRPVKCRRILVNSDHIVDVEPCEYNIRMRGNTPTYKDARDLWLAPTWGTRVSTILSQSFVVTETFDEIEALLDTEHVVEEV